MTMAQFLRLRFREAGSSLEAPAVYGSTEVEAALDGTETH
jgi:hypothetical protein